MIQKSDKLAIYMRDHVGLPEGKMGYGVLRYSTQPIVCVVDAAKAGGDMTTAMGIAGRHPIVATVAEAKALGATVLVLGAANRGGFVPPGWYADLDAAVDLGMSLVNGLHDRLAPRYADLKPGQWIWDVRTEPAGLGVAHGRAMQLRNQRVLFVGSDMNVGKMTAALEMWREARQRGRRAEFVATGQTGITIAGSGIPLDAIRLDYACGAVEAEVLRYPDAEMVFVEGQGALGHPASTATLPLMRGSAPTHLVFCHRAGQQTLRSLTQFAIPPLRDYIKLYVDLASAVGTFPRPRVVGACLNTAHLDEADARRSVEALAAELQLPVTDPVRYGTQALVDALEALS